MVNPSELTLRNIRDYKGNFVVRIMRRKNTLKEARRLQKYIEQFINCVNIYEDVKRSSFIVQTYKEYKKIEDAIKIRDFLEKRLSEYK